MAVVIFQHFSPSPSNRHSLPPIEFWTQSARKFTAFYPVANEVCFELLGHLWPQCFLTLTQHQQISVSYQSCILNTSMSLALFLRDRQPPSCSHTGLRVWMGTPALPSNLGRCCRTVPLRETISPAYCPASNLSNGHQVESNRQRWQAGSDFSCISSVWGF